MPLSFSIGNIATYLSHISPIAISLFLVFQSAFEFNFKGLIYLAGVILNWFITLLVKFSFYKPR